jgi:putative hydrolase of HD superfamily
MIRKRLVERLYESASIQRWNDHVRPVELTELDKQAHKMVIAYVIAKSEETERKAAVNWLAIIEGGIFELLQRVILTDIKPPVFHKMMMNKGKELNQWVLNQLADDLTGVSPVFKEKFTEYFSNSAYACEEKRILRAAHYLATNWEFRIIYNMNPFIYGIERTKAEIENQLEDHYDLIGVQKLALGKKSFGFVDLCGQLRFQQRWAQSPRIPKTSVLGHMLIVAVLSYLCSDELNACDKRIYNNFFAALFHDLPEVLTRDIVSPVKSSVEGLQEIIKEYERIQLEERVLPLLPYSWHDEIRYFTDDEFENKVIIGGKTQKGVTSADIKDQYNENQYSPLDGGIIRACDHLAAFIEASLSIQHGIKSHHLEDGKRKLYEDYRNSKIAGINFGQIFDAFSGN